MDSEVSCLQSSQISTLCGNFERWFA
jgi:hypothetical protein